VSASTTALCVDVGSTFTKAVAVALTGSDAGRVLGTAVHRTTIETDVLVGLDAVAAELAPLTGADPDLRVCSSAGGGLRLAVVGYEQAVTAEAGRRVGLSAGAKVVHVACGPMDGHDVQVLRDSRPDVVLLVGGTDGGNATVLRHNASRLAKARLGAPVVVAGNEAAADEVMASLASTGRSAVVAANVLPRIGTLEPEGARSAIREVFLRHVIGGKGLSRGPRFASLVRAATPDAVLSGVEVLADGAPGHGVPALGDVLVVDVGGATTDVYSVITPHGEDATLRKEVVAPMWRARTVEGDLGMRWGATATVEAAVAERLLEPGDQRRLGSAARQRVADPGWLPTTRQEVADDLDLARLAVTVALRRHARPPSEKKAGKDLRRVVAVVGSGGVLRHADLAGRDSVLAPATSDHAGGWRVPHDPVRAVDDRSVLCAAGLLHEDHPRAAALLAHGLLRSGRLASMRRA
jgi:uncharacterized protein (TIGR01319 family)